MADELVDAVFAAASVHARVGSAFVYVAEASGVVVTTWTFAAIAVDEVHADSTVRAWVGSAFVDVSLTVLAGETWDALAGISEKREEKCEFMKEEK